MGFRFEPLEVGEEKCGVTRALLFTILSKINITLVTQIKKGIEVKLPK